MNWYKKLFKLADDMAGYRRRPYSGPPRYFGPMRLISFMGRPAIIGNTMKMDRNILQQLGFTWQGNTQIDGEQLGDVPGNIIYGAMIGSQQLIPEEIDVLAQAGVDVSMVGIEFYPPQAQPVAPSAPEATDGVQESHPVDGSGLIEDDKGAQSDEENLEMLMRLRSSSKNYQDTRNVVQEQLNKLTEIMTNPNLTAEQEKLREDFLNFMKGAHKYSLWNSIMIFMQRRDAEMVGGAKNLWQNKGRAVKPGEEPIFVLAPIMRKTKLSRQQYFAMLNDLTNQGLSQEEAKKEIQRRTSGGRPVGFKDVPVYDIKQTEPIPGWKDPQTGEGPFGYENFHQSYKYKINDPDQYADALWKATVSAMQQSGIEVAQTDTGSAGGMSSGGRVRIDQSSLGARRLATLFHEYAHEVLHTNEEGRKKWAKEKTPKHIIEAEAEATAYLLMQAFDMQGDPEWAARYLLLWKATPQEVMQRQENIHKAYSTIHNNIISYLDKIIAQKTGQQVQASVSWYKKLKNAAA